MQTIVPTKLRNHWNLMLEWKTSTIQGNVAEDHKVEQWLVDPVPFMQLMESVG